MRTLLKKRIVIVFNIALVIFQAVEQLMALGQLACHLHIPFNICQTIVQYKCVLVVTHVDMVGCTN